MTKVRAINLKEGHTIIDDGDVITVKSAYQTGGFDMNIDTYEGSTICCLENDEFELLGGN